MEKEDPFADISGLGRRMLSWRGLFGVFPDDTRVQKDPRLAPRLDAHKELRWLQRAVNQPALLDADLEHRGICRPHDLSFTWLQPAAAACINRASLTVLPTRIDMTPGPTWFPCTKLMGSVQIYHFLLFLFFFHFTQSLWLVSLLPSFLLPKHLIPQLIGDRTGAGLLVPEYRPPNRGASRLPRARSLRAHSTWTLGHGPLPFPSACGLVSQLSSWAVFPPRAIHPPKKNDQEYQILLTEELKKYLRGNSLPGTHKLGCWLGLEISV